MKKKVNTIERIKCRTCKKWGSCPWETGNGVVRYSEIKSVRQRDGGGRVFTKKNIYKQFDRQTAIRGQGQGLGSSNFPLIALVYCRF
jgi:hypothetical protein